MRLTLLAALGLAATALTATVLTTTPASAQQQAATAAAKSTPSFLEAAAAGNKFEIDSSQLALAKSDSAAVKDFARMMVKDHGEAATRLEAAVAEAKAAPPAEKLDARHQAMLDDLKQKDGAAFDKAYIDAQRKAHVETVALFEAYAGSGDNPRIKAFAAELLPSLKAHLEQVKKLK